MNNGSEENRRNMEEQGKRIVKKKLPVSHDIFLGVLAMGVFGAVGICSGIFNWLGIYIMGVLVSSMLVVIEALRYYVPLPRHYRSARNVAMAMVSIALICNLLYLFVRGVFRLY